MRGSNEGISLLDAMALISFFVGIANYDENVDQSSMNKTVKRAVDDIHKHLAIQDEKIDLLLSKLEGGQA
jgi:hypothetical protein